VVRFQSLDDSFLAEIVFDDIGLVLAYPAIGRVAAEFKVRGCARKGTLPL
jgi:hypothetical protein